MNIDLGEKNFETCDECSMYPEKTQQRFVSTNRLQDNKYFFGYQEYMSAIINVK